LIGRGVSDRFVSARKHDQDAALEARPGQPAHRSAGAPVAAIGYAATDEEGPMDGTVDITIPVEPIAAAELRDSRKREAVGRLVSPVLRREREQNVDLLFAAIEQLGSAAEAKGLTDEILQEELAAYNAERRS
jgi:hypothetical protein